MAFFRKRSPEVIRRGAHGQVIEERKKLRLGGQKVEVKRVIEPAKPSPEPQRKAKGKSQSRKGSNRAQKGNRDEQRNRSRQRREEEIIIPTESARKQMLVRVTPHQTQCVVLEGPVLVEHYVASADRTSLVGNIYLGRVRNVLPGMEAAFVDFGAAKNGVVYASDISIDRE